MRHTDAGLAIPDFPWMFGHLIPDHWDPKIAIHFAHRVGALCVTLMLLATTGHVFAHHRRRLELLRPSILLLVLVSRPDHARRAHRPQPQGIHHQLAPRRDGRLRARDHPRPHAARASRPLRRRARAGGRRRRQPAGRPARITPAPRPEPAREDRRARRRRAARRRSRRQRRARGRLGDAHQAAPQPARPHHDARRPLPRGAGRRLHVAARPHARRIGARRGRRRRAQPGARAHDRRADAPHAQPSARRRPARRRGRLGARRAAVARRPRGAGGVHQPHGGGGRRRSRW